MISQRSWITMGLLCAGMAAAGTAKAQQIRDHSSLMTFLQGHTDTTTTAPAPALKIPSATTPVAAPSQAVVATVVAPLKVDEMPAAAADDFVIYTHMWQKNKSELCALGRYQLELIARRIKTVNFPVVIEMSHDDKLDNARRDMVISLLGQRGFHDPKRVIVAFPADDVSTAAAPAQGSADCGAGHCGH